MLDPAPSVDRPIGRYLLAGELRVLPLRSLFRHTQHRSDLAPRAIGSARGAYRLDKRRLDTLASISKLADSPQHLSVSNDERVTLDTVSPLLERANSLSA